MERGTVLCVEGMTSMRVCVEATYTLELFSLNQSLNFQVRLKIFGCQYDRGYRALLFVVKINHTHFHVAKMHTLP